MGARNLIERLRSAKVGRDDLPRVFIAGTVAAILASAVISSLIKLALGGL